MLRCATRISAIFVSAVIIALCFPVSISAAGLLGLSDYITDQTPSRPAVTHHIGFVIPATGHTIVPTDYIRIVLTNYSSVTAPTSGNGWTGSPSYGVIGNVAYVTGVSASPGTGIGISGITATNPANPSQFGIVVQIANDINGSIVYDSAAVQAVVNSASNTASVTIPSTTSAIDFSGYTSPDAFVIIEIDGVIAGTTMSDANGNFNKLFTSLTYDYTHNISIYAQDTLNRYTERVNFSVYTLANTTHVISNITLPTTISLGETQVTEGGNVPVFGRSHPFSQITIFVGTGILYSEVVQANAEGWWAYSFNSTLHPLPVGTHGIYAQEVVLGGFTSPYTQTVIVTIKESHGQKPPPIGIPVVSCSPGSDGEWINSNDVTCTWTSPPGSTGYSYLLTPDPSEMPSETVLTQRVSKTFQDLEDGIYYFKVMAYNGTWSDVYTYSLKVDTTPPENLVVESIPDINEVISELPVLTFSAIDTLSGMDHYEISIDGGPFTIIESPYKIPQLTGGEHSITIKAVDVAGNATIKTLIINVAEVTPPVITNPHDGDTFPINDPIVIEGTAPPDSLVYIYIDGKLIGEIRSDSNGKFRYLHDTFLFPGTHTIYCTVENEGGITSSKSEIINFSIDMFAIKIGSLNIPIACCCPLILLVLLLFIVFWKRRRDKSKQRLYNKVPVVHSSKSDKKLRS